MKPGEVFFSDCGYAESQRIKHGIAVVLEESAVVGEGDQAGDGEIVPPEADAVSDADPVVFGKHAVQDEVALFFRKGSVHQAEPIDLIAELKQAQGVPVLHPFFHVKIVIQPDAV